MTALYPNYLPLYQAPAVHCKIPNFHQEAPLLPVMQHYTTHVSPACPDTCICHFYYFVIQDISSTSTPSYTISVNCTRQNLTMFPSLPPHTVVLDLSHNKLDTKAFYQLDIEKDNYQDVATLILSHNRLKRLYSSFDYTISG